MALCEQNRTQVWLIQQLRSHGIITDKTEMSSALAGSRHGPKVEDMLRISAEILGI